MTPPKSASTPISPSKSAALSRVLDLVTKGYTRYIGGTCPASKAIRLAQKLNEKYAIGCSPAQRITRRQKGWANAALVMYWPGSGEGSSPPSGEGSNGFERTPEHGTEVHAEPSANSALTPAVEVRWLMLVTAGDGPVVEQESLADVNGAHRLLWLGYELVRLPKRGGVVWTWRRPKAEMAEWYALLGDQLARRQMSAVAESLRRMARQPGFSGVRQQGWELVQFARGRGYAGEVPYLFHMEKIAHGLPLSLN